MNFNFGVLVDYSRNAERGFSRRFGSIVLTLGTWRYIAGATVIGLVGLSVNAADSASTRPKSRGPTAKYVGAIVCVQCHLAQGQLQSTSAHAHALTPVNDRSGVFLISREVFRPPRYRFQFDGGNNGYHVTISDGASSWQVPVDWAFGAGQQATTFVGRVDRDHYIEHFFSYYADMRLPGPTPGQIGLPSNTLSLAAGLMYSPADPVTGIVKCFECHSTGKPHVDASNRITPHESGVRCEACHGPGSLHVNAVQTGQLSKARSSITNPAHLSAGALNQLCGKCHRTLDPKSDFQWNKAWSVRQQPVYLDQSKCLWRGNGKLSCLTCHNPHAPLQTDSSSYDAKCSGCHHEPKHSETTAIAEHTCIECHMPRVTPQEHLTFTNHWIGIYKADNKIVPVQ